METQQKEHNSQLNPVNEKEGNLEQTAIFISKKLSGTYALGGFGKNIAYGLVAGYTLYYYNAILGISASFVGFLLMAARIFDAANDPLMGIVVAKTRSRWGRYKPWIFTGALLNAMVLFAMFSVPEGLDGGSLKLYVAVTYLLCGITYTLSDIPYWAIIPAITRPGNVRDRFTMNARTMAGIGAAIPTIITIAAVNILADNQRTGFSLLALLVGIFYLFTTVLMLFYLPNEEIEDPQEATMGEMLQALFRNDRALWICLVIVLFNTAIYFTTNLLIYLFRFDVGNEAQYTLFMIISGMFQLLGMVAVYPAMHRHLDNYRIYAIACIVGFAGYAIFIGFIPIGNLTLLWILVPGICISLANGLNYILITIFIADAVDYGQDKTGHRQDSMIASLQTLMVKLASALAVFIAGIGLDWVQLNEAANIQSIESVLRLRILFGMPGMLCMLLAGVLFYRFIYHVTKGES